jgi:hypothetical protein
MDPIGGDFADHAPYNKFEFFLGNSCREYLLVPVTRDMTCSSTINILSAF